MSPPDNSAESPDLGPPPVAHFEEGDPIKYDTITKVQESDNVTSFPVETSFSNLETRKKRRESSYTREENRPNDLDPSNVSVNQPILNSILGQPLKSGAKRKFSARDEEKRNEPSVPTMTDGFRFSRRNEGTSEGYHDASKPEQRMDDGIHCNRTAQDILEARSTSTDKPSEAIKNLPAVRRALGESIRS